MSDTLTRVEPLSAFALMVAQVGARRLVGALAGDDAGGLAAGVLGLLTGVEQSQSRLISLEQQMKALLNQHYTASLNNGTRLLKQSAMPGRPAGDRERNLYDAATNLRDAAHVATTPVQAAVAERQLLLTELARGDLGPALEAWRKLDLHFGDAITRNYLRHEQPAEETRKRISDGEFGQITLLEKFQTPDPRWHRAWATVRSDARTAASELAVLLEDAVSGAELVGVDNGLGSTRPRLPRRLGGLIGAAPATHGPAVVAHSSTIALDVPLGSKVVVGGIEAMLHGILSTSARPLDHTGYLDHELGADVFVAAERRETPDVWVQGSGSFEVRQVRPGERVTVTGKSYHSPELPDRRIELAVGGLLLSAALP